MSFDGIGISKRTVRFLSVALAILLAVSPACDDDEPEPVVSQDGIDEGSQDITGEGVDDIDDEETVVDTELETTEDGGDPDVAPTPQTTFPTSLHATRRGMQTWFDGTEGQPGIGSLAGVSYEDLSCEACHGDTRADGTSHDGEFEASCADCHADVENPTGEIADEICLGCHRRQQVEAAIEAEGFPTFVDVHSEGFLHLNCVNCHTADELHGDGNEWASMHELEQPSPVCTGCHFRRSENPEHLVHWEDVDCAACHVQSAIACPNCHLESAEVGVEDRFFGSPLHDFVLLVNREGSDRVYPATFVTVTHEDNSFVALAPSFGHTISSPGRICGDCHGNANVQAYDENGTIPVVTWTPGSGDDLGTLTGPSGVVPVPPDWTTALEFDFLDYTAEDLTTETDPNLWELLESEPDLMQMLYATPLTEEQMEALSQER